jgi:hypothetical protein
MEKTQSKGEHFTQTVTLLAALISLIISIVSALGGMTPAVQRILLPSTVVITLCCISAVFGQTGLATARAASKVIRQHHLVPKYFDKFGAFVDRLQPLCDPGRCDNIPSVLRSFPPLLSGIFTDIPIQSQLGDLARTLTSMHIGLAHTKRNLALSVRWFDSILTIYDRQCISGPLREIRVCLDKGIDAGKRAQCDHLIREYQKVKLGYVMFREQYAEFARDINKAFGEPIAREYYEKPDEL